MAVRQAKKEGFSEALQIVRVSFLEAGDSKFDGFAAAEWVRKLGLD